MSFNLHVSAVFVLSIALVPLPFAANAAAAAGTLVLFNDGQKIQVNKSCYILPAMRGNGGGLALAQRNNTCPFYVALNGSETSLGLRLKFLPVDAKQTFVEVSKDMNFVFSAATKCGKPTGWRLEDADGAGQRYIITDAKTGSPGGGTVSNWFKIEKYKDAYKLDFCPAVCSDCKVKCGDVGVYVEDGKRWLGLSNVPLQVKFKRWELNIRDRRTRRIK